MYGKSDDFKKHASLSTTGEVFPWEGASDAEVRLVDEQINCKVAMVMNAIKRGYRCLANGIERRRACKRDKQFPSLAHQYEDDRVLL